MANLLAKASLDSVAEEEEDETTVKSSNLVVEEVKVPLPVGVDDYDEECTTDPFAVALYANDIFHYYKQREVRACESCLLKTVCDQICD